MAREVGPAEARLYELVWQRTVASQMNDAVGETVTVRLGGAGRSGRDAEFATSGTVITKPTTMKIVSAPNVTIVFIVTAPSSNPSSRRHAIPHVRQRG